MTRRSRLLCVLAIIVGGAIALIGSTQTWLTVTLNAGAVEPLDVPGASALPLLAPLSLAALALGLALTVVGRVLRYVFGVLATVIGECSSSQPDASDWITRWMPSRRSSRSRPVCRGRGDRGSRRADRGHSVALPHGGRGPGSPGRRRPDPGDRAPLGAGRAPVPAVECAARCRRLPSARRDRLVGRPLARRRSDRLTRRLRRVRANR